MRVSKIFLILLGILLAVSDICYGQNLSQNNNTSGANANQTNVAVDNRSNQAANRSADTQVNSATQTNSNSSPTETNSSASAPKTNDPVIQDIFRLGYENDKDKRNKAGIRDIIIVKVKNLKKLVDRSLCRDEKGVKVNNCTNQNISLFIEGRKIDVDLEAISLNENGGNDGTLQFHLTRSAGANDEAWADLLGNPSVSDDFFLRKNTKMSIGLANEFAVAEPVLFNLIRIREYRFWIFTILYIFLLFLIFRLAVKSDILRDIGDPPDGAVDPKAYGILRAFEFGKKDEIRKPYSLARFQMAWWFLLVIGSFFYIWLITGALDIITTEILALIGIGAGTALGAAAIDSGKRESVKTDLKTKDEEIKKLESEIADLDAEIAAPPPDLTTLQTLQKDKAAKEEKWTQLNAKIEADEKRLKAKSEGFLKDVLSDSTGVSFHRFQIFVWTLVLGIIFIISVWTRLSMPEFGATLLALLGISAGTYLGFKIPENETTG